MHVRSCEVDRRFEAERRAPDRSRLLDQARKILDSRLGAPADERETCELGLREDRASQMLGSPESGARVVEHLLCLIEEPTADEDLAEVRTRERCLGRVAEALELVARMRVVVRCLSPAPFCIRSDTQVRRDHRGGSRGPDLPVDLESLDLVDGLLGLAELEVRAVEGVVGDGKGTTRAERLRLAHDLGRDRDRLAGSSLLQEDLRTECQQTVGAVLRFGGVEGLDRVETGRRVTDRRAVGAESRPGDRAFQEDLCPGDGVVLEQSRGDLECLDRASIVARCVAHLAERAPRAPRARTVAECLDASALASIARS